MLKVVGYEPRVLTDGDTIMGLIRGLAKTPIDRKHYFYCNVVFTMKNGKRNFNLGEEVFIPVMQDPDITNGDNNESQ